MGNKRQEKMLHQGTEVWNAWRKRYVDEQLDLQGADLRGVDLQGAHLSDVDLRGAILTGADLSGADLWGAHLSEADLQRAVLVHADLRGAHFDQANLSGANLSEAQLGSADFQKANLSHANLYNALCGKGTSFHQANLASASFSGAHLEQTNLSEVVLDHADLIGAYLQGANLYKASLQSALLRHTDVSGALLEFTDLSKSLLYGTNFSHAYFHQTNFSLATMGWSTFDNVDLRGCDGLATVEHIGPSEISVRTLYRTSDTLPDVFLHRAGIPTSFLQNTAYLFLRKPEDAHYFICYTAPHHEFAQQIKKDLSMLDMSCWTALVDTNSTLSFWHFINNVNTLYDRLIFVLPSEGESEEISRISYLISMAMQKEQQEKQHCFSLVTVDKAEVNVDLLQMLAERDHAARSIISFTPWQSSATYTHALQALLRDLALV